MNNRTLFAALAAYLALLTPALHAQVPQLINYQGRVAVGTVNFEGTGQFRFALVNAAGTTVYWGNAADTAPADGVPDAAVSLPVSKGLYSVLIGDTSLTGMAAIPASVWANADVRLRVWFNDGTNGNQLLTPDQRLAPNGYLPDGSVTNAAIAASAVTSAKINDNAVTSTKINTGAVNAAKIAAGAVTTVKIAAGAVTDDQLASGIDAGKITIGTFPALSGANLTGLNASSLSTGTLSDLRLSANVPRLDANNTFFTGAQGSIGIHPNYGVGNNTTLLGSYTSATNDGAQLRFARTGDFVDIGQNGIGAFVIETNNDVPRFALTQSGDVGIGNVSPVSKLNITDGHVVVNTTDAAGSLGYSIFDSANSERLALGMAGGIGAYSTDAAAGDAVLRASQGKLLLQSGVAGAAMTIATNNRVGIGTTSPTTKLDVAGTVKATAFSGDGSGLTGVVATSTARTPQQIALLKWGVSSANNTFAVGDGPVAICFDGASIWVANSNSDNVTKLNASTGAVQGTYNVGDGPRGICFDGASIWAANRDSFNVTKL